MSQTKDLGQVTRAMKKANDLDTAIGWLEANNVVLYSLKPQFRDQVLSRSSHAGIGSEEPAFFL